MERDTTPVACTLSLTDQASQALEWRDLVARALTTERTSSGATLRFPLHLRDEVEDLAARESACCGFLSIGTSLEDDEVVLAVGSELAEAQPVIDVIVGATNG